MYIQKPLLRLHPQKFTVWCTYWTFGIIFPYFLKGNVGQNRQNVTVNEELFRFVINDFFVSQLNGVNVQVQLFWCQKEGAICHTTRDTIRLLHNVPVIADNLL